MQYRWGRIDTVIHWHQTKEEHYGRLYIYGLSPERYWRSRRLEILFVCHKGWNSMLMHWSLRAEVNTLVIEWTR
jgi:hypothetical protein